MDPRKEFARELLGSVAPAELEFFQDYYDGIGAADPAGELGPEFGLQDIVSVGPFAVSAAVFVYALLLQWLADVPKKVVEGFLVDRAKSILAGFANSPTKTAIGSAVTPAGRTEILSIVGGLAVKAKLSPEEAELVVRKVAEQLFGSTAT